MFCVVLCGPRRFRSRVQFSSAHSSKGRRFDASMSPSWKVAVHKSAMAVGGSRSILFCTKQSSSSMTTPLLLSYLLELWDESAMLDFNPVDLVVVPVPVAVGCLGLVADSISASLHWSAHARPDTQLCSYHHSPDTCGHHICAEIHRFASDRTANTVLFDPFSHWQWAIIEQFNDVYTRTRICSCFHSS